jgi:predicted MFS family arabinose efflux permease
MNKKTVISLFLLAVLIVGISTGIFRSTFDNYLKEVHSFTGTERGMIEFPRELFGFLIVFVIGALHFIREPKLIALGTLGAALSYFGFAFITPNFSWLIIWTLMWSFGSHIFVNLRSVLAINIADKKNKGHFLGKMGAVNSVGFIIGTCIIWIFITKLNFTFSFLAASFFAALSALIFAFLPIHKHYDLAKRHKFIFKKKYRHYYILSLLFGVRKQLFLVFAPWFIVETLKQPANIIANILFIAAILGIFLGPKLGKLIDHWGEKKVLIYDGISLGIISGGYVIAPYFLNGYLLLLAAASFYIIDEILFSLKYARDIYLYKISECKKDITPTMATGLTIEHIVSMSMPIAAGLIWVHYGYQWVFSFCALLALFTAWYVFKFL